MCFLEVVDSSYLPSTLSPFGKSIIALLLQEKPPQLFEVLALLFCNHISHRMRAHQYSKMMSDEE